MTSCLRITTRNGRRNSYWLGSSMDLSSWRILKPTHQGVAPDPGAESESYDCLVFTDENTLSLSLSLTHTHTHTHTHPFNGPLSRTTRVSRCQRGKTNLDFTEARVAVSGSGISWAICKSEPHSRQTTMPAPHHSISVL